MQRRRLTALFVLTLMVIGAVLRPGSAPESVLETRGSGVLIPGSDVAYAQQDTCWGPCLAANPLGWANFEWAVFNVEPRLWQTPTPPQPPLPTQTPHVLAWQVHPVVPPAAAIRFPPVSVKVKWGNHIETMEIQPDGTTVGTHPNILFHDVSVRGCDIGATLPPNSSTSWDIQPGAALQVSTTT